MASKEKLKKELKRVRKESEKAQEKRKKAEKKLKKLQEVLRSLDKKRADKKKKDKKSKVAEAAEQEDTDIVTSGVASSQREAWKRHSFLRDRYEAYLGAGDCKSDARAMANKDLEKEFGTECGYTEAELQDILT